MRDRVVEEIVENALQNSSIYLLLGDLGVYQARKGIKAIPEQVFNYGIREQSMISFATGISLAKGYPFVYSINPFLNERAVEQIKNGPAYNNTPMCIVTAGGTCDYYKLGKTHYCTNDINNLLAHDLTQIFLPFNEEEAAIFTNLSIKNRYFSSIRLSSSSIKGLPTNKFDRDYQGKLNIYIGPDALIYKDHDRDEASIYLSMINTSLLKSLSKSISNCREINMYAAFNAYSLYMSILKYIAASKEAERDITITINHVPSIKESSVRAKEEILRTSTEVIALKI